MNTCVSRKHFSRAVVLLTFTLAQRGIVRAQALSPQDIVLNDAAVQSGDFIAKAVSSSLPADSLPDAPLPQSSDYDQTRQTSEPNQTHINAIPLLSPRLASGTVLTAHDKWEIYYHKTYSPAAIIYPLFGAGITMANPKKGYPREWQDGMGAFGRNYGNSIAERTARSTADLGTQVLFHEDPRYQRSGSTNSLARVGHALIWTVVDKSDSGHRTFAMSTFTSAAAGGFVGMAYLPDGYNDVTHAEQRMAMGIEGRVVSNLLTEFEPVWGPWAAKLRIPKLLPEWWVPQSKR